MKITEQYILLLAPNAAAASNGKKLSQSGKFQTRGQNADSNIYWAECAGSGKNPYRTSIDFSISESAPTCRCSCPSRQFPCKHALGLLYEILAEKEFAVEDIPADLAEKKRSRHPAQPKKRKEHRIRRKRKNLIHLRRKRRLQNSLKVWIWHRNWWMTFCPAD